MAGKMIQVSDGFWNIRGSYRVAGVLDVGTQSSLVRLADGGFVLLDCCMLSGATKRAVNELTDNGRQISAIINLHPFHTLHVKQVHSLYPEAALYGTQRHHDRQAELPWADIRTEDEAFHRLYANDFDFSVPAGVDFIPRNESLHFASVLALHRASATIHSDDTLVYLRLPALLRLFGLGDSVGFHPTLAKVLQRRAGAAAEFRAWAKGLIEGWGGAENLCAAHTGALLGRENKGASIKKRMQKALAKIEPVIDAHEKKYG